MTTMTENPKDQQLIKLRLRVKGKTQQFSAKIPHDNQSSQILMLQHFPDQFTTFQLVRFREKARLWPVTFYDREVQFLALSRSSTRLAQVLRMGQSYCWNLHFVRMRRLRNAITSASSICLTEIVYMQYPEATHPSMHWLTVYRLQPWAPSLISLRNSALELGSINQER